MNCINYKKNNNQQCKLCLVKQWVKLCLMIFQKGLGILLRGYLIGIISLEWWEEPKIHFINESMQCRPYALVWRNAADSPRDILSGHAVLPMEINFSHCRENSVLAINKNLANTISDRLFDNSRFTDDGVLSNEFNFKCIVDILGRTSVWILAVTVLCDPHKGCFVKTKMKSALIDTF